MIDKEGIALVEDVRKALIQYGRQTESSSVKKKTRKVTSQLIWSAEEYIDALDNIKATSKNEAEMVERVRSLIRTAEEDALRSMTVTPDDTGHHLVQSRTGGDALTEISYERSGPIISRLSEKHQRTFGNTLGSKGNLPPEMSLSNYAHKSDDRATGLERESGIGKNPDKTTVAHSKGTAYYANMKGVDMTDDAAIEAALDYKVTEQINQGRIAAQTDAPRQAALRELTGNNQLYRGPVPEDLILNRDDVLKSYQALTSSNGSVRLNRKAMAAIPLIPATLGISEAFNQARAGDLSAAGGTLADTVIGEIPIVDALEAQSAAYGTVEEYGGGDARTEYELQRAKDLAPMPALVKTPVDENRNQERLELEERSRQARERGGRVKIGAGKASFTLPEFGLSELFGLN